MSATGARRRWCRGGRWRARNCRSFTRGRRRRSGGHTFPRALGRTIRPRLRTPRDETSEDHRHSEQGGQPVHALHLPLSRASLGSLARGRRAVSARIRLMQTEHLWRPARRPPKCRLERDRDLGRGTTSTAAHHTRQPRRKGQPVRARPGNESTPDADQAYGSSAYGSL